MESDDDMFDVFDQPAPKALEAADDVANDVVADDALAGGKKRKAEDGGSQAVR